MVAVANTLEGITNGAALTDVNSASGGNAFDGVSISGSNVAPTADTTRAAHGTRSMRVATGATAGSSYVFWDTTSMPATGTIHFRFNAYFTAYPAATATVFRVMNAAAIAASLQVTSAGLVRVMSSTSVITSLTEAFPLNQWFRVEGRLTAAGALDLRRYDSMDAALASPSESITATGQAFSTTFDSFRFGLQSSSANWGPAWFDDLALSDTAFVGPAGSTTGPVATAPVNTSLPTISGTPQVGVQLTSTSGAWTQSPTSYARQWKANGTNISGATNPTYTPVVGDVGKTITVTVTATNSIGSTAATSAATTAVTAAGTGSNLAYWFENPNKTIPGGAVTYTGTTLAGLLTAIDTAGVNGTVVIDSNSVFVGNFDRALPDGITIMNAPGRRPWIEGGTAASPHAVRISGGERVRIWGLNVRWTDPANHDAHMVKWDGGSGEWGYSEFTLPGTLGCYTILRPGQTIHDWRVHHCWIHDNPGRSSAVGGTHDGNQDHGFYCSSPDETQNGLIDHCLIEDTPFGRNIKLGGSSSSNLVGGDIRVRFNTLRKGYGPSNGQVSYGMSNSSWDHNLLIDSGDPTNLTDGPSPGAGNTYSFNKGDSVVGPNATTFRDAGGNVNNVPLATLQDFAAQGALGFGHLEGQGSQPTNQAPTANAGTNQTGIAAGATVTLTGSGTDPDGSIAGYTWSQTGGPTVTLAGTGTTRTFTAPSVVGGATLTFTLRVTDNVGAISAPAPVTVTVAGPTTGGNAAPVASAGPDQSGKTAGQTVTLTGVGTDGDGTVTTYNWTQTGGPTVTLNGSGAVRTFQVPSVTVPATLTFRLTVTDNLGAVSAADFVNIGVLAVGQRVSYGPVVIATPTPSTADGNALAFSTATFPVRRTRGGANETNLQTVNSGTPISELVPDPTTGAAEWLGPEGYRGMMWVHDPVTGIDYPVVPNDIADRVSGGGGDGSGTVTGIRVNGGATQGPDGSGVIDLTVQAGGVVDPTTIRIPATQITDSSGVGRSVLTAVSAQAARTAIAALGQSDVDARVNAYFIANPVAEHGNTYMMPVWDGVGAHPTRPAGLPDGFYVLWRQPFAPTVGANYARLGDEWKVV